MQEILQSRIISLEFIGLLLAVLSFTGATEKIERGLSSLRSWVADYTPALRRGLVEFLPTPANFRRHGASFMWTEFVNLAVMTAVLLYAPETREKVMSFYDFILPWTWWKAALLMLGAIPALYLAASISGFVLGVSAYLILSAVWSLFWLLSRPPSGVMGSIGLLIALTGSLIRT